MHKHTTTEIAVGLFVLVGAAALAYLSVSIGGVDLAPGDRYAITARFASVGDLDVGAPVKIAGVKVGEVRDIRLKEYAGETELAIDSSVELPDDTIASIYTAGLLGSTYVSLSAGSSLNNMADGDRIQQTEPAINVLELLGKYAFGSSEEKKPEGKEDPVFPDPLE